MNKIDDLETRKTEIQQTFEHFEDRQLAIGRNPILECQLLIADLLIEILKELQSQNHHEQN